MRSRGANITDIVVLVVAADDSVMAQTIEAINHAKASGCPVIVAVNKCDKPEADPQRVRNDLLQHEIITEDFGGDVLCVDVSATTGLGLDKLEESIMLQAELLELKANPDRNAEGVVIESKVESGGVVLLLPCWSSVVRSSGATSLSSVPRAVVSERCLMTAVRICKQAGRSARRS